MTFEEFHRKYPQQRSGLFRAQSQLQRDPQFRRDYAALQQTAPEETHIDAATGEVKRNPSVGRTLLQGAPFLAAPLMPALLGLGGGAGGAAGAAGSAGTAGAGAAGAGGAAATGGGVLGALGTAGKLANVVSPILGGASASRAENLAAQERSQLARDQLELQRWQAAQRAPGQRLSTATRASILKNAAPVMSSWGGPGSGLRGQKVSFGGGYATPGLVDARAKQLADDVIAQQLASQLGREGPPGVTPAPRPGALDKLLGGAALGTSILGGANTVLGRRPPPILSQRPPLQEPLSRNVRLPTFGGASL